MSLDDLKKWMADNKHTAITLAAALGVTRRTTFRWLSGDSPIPKWLVHAINGLAK